MRALYDRAAERDKLAQLGKGSAVLAAEPFNPFIADKGVHLFDLSLLREADGWKAGDVASMGEDEHWLLSWLLAFDPFDN